MANKRKPDNVHQLQGTHRKDRHGDLDTKIQLDSKLPKPPTWLPQFAKKEWQRVCNIMKAVGVITEADASVLTQYCLLYSEMKKVKEEFQAAKHTQLRLCAAELGLTPVSRSKIVVGKVNRNEFDDI